MSADKQAKRQSYNLRREQRIARLKTAATLMPFFLRDCNPSSKADVGEVWLNRIKEAARYARVAADILIAGIDATAPQVKGGDDE